MCSSSSLIGVIVDVKGFEVIKERREYESRRSAFDISENKHRMSSYDDEELRKRKLPILDSLTLPKTVRSL